MLIVTLSYFPLVYLPVAAALRGLDPALEEIGALARATAAGGRSSGWCCRSCGRRCSAARCWSALHLLAEFGALQMLRFPTFTTAIYDQYQSTFNGAGRQHAGRRAGAAAAWCCCWPSCGCAGARGTPGSARGAPAPATPAPARARTPAGAAAGLAALVVLALGVPLGSLVRWLVDGSSTAFPLDELLQATAHARSASALAGAALTTVLALPVAWLAVRAPRPAQHRCSSAAPTSPRAARASWSRWRW